MSKLSKKRILNDAILNKRCYFQSLLEKGYEFELLSEIEIEQLQENCLSILSEISYQYTKGQSSSVKVETAQNLLGSIFFTLGIRLKAFEHPDDAIEAIKLNSLNQLFKEGQVLLEDNVTSLKEVYQKNLKFKIIANYDTYEETYISAIEGFFSNYDVKYLSQEKIITADYPTLVPVEDLDGIEFIETYLQNIHYENIFCKNFSNEHIQYLLGTYNKDYNLLIFNIAEIIIYACLAKELCQTSSESLVLDEQSFVRLVQRLTLHHKKKTLKELLQTTLNHIWAQYTYNPWHKDYFAKSNSNIIFAIENAVALNTLDQMFVFEKINSTTHEEKFIDGNQISNKDYRQLIDSLYQTNSFDAQLDLIKETIRSLEDLEDLILDMNIEYNNILKILKLLSPPEIKYLMEKYHVAHSDWQVFYAPSDHEFVLAEALYHFTQ